MKTDFHNKDFALSLALKWRRRWTRKWHRKEKQTNCDWVRSVFRHLSIAVFLLIFFSIGRFHCSRLMGWFFKSVIENCFPCLKWFFLFRFVRAVIIQSWGKGQCSFWLHFFNDSFIRWIIRIILKKCQGSGVIPVKDVPMLAWDEFWWGKKLECSTVIHSTRLNCGEQRGTDTSLWCQHTRLIRITST